MENYTPEWWNNGELADAVRLSRRVTVEARIVAGAGYRQRQLR